MLSLYIGWLKKASGNVWNGGGISFPFGEGGQESKLKAG